MFRLGRVKIRANPRTAGEFDAGHEVSDQNITLLDDFHVEKVREGLHIQESNNIRVHFEEERKRRGQVCSENCAVEFLDSRLEELLGALEPGIVQPVGERAYDRPTVAAGDRQPGGSGNGWRLRLCGRWRCHHSAAHQSRHPNGFEDR